MPSDLFDLRPLYFKSLTMNSVVRAALLLVAVLAYSASAKNVEKSSPKAIYYNPVLDFGAADPFVAFHDGLYHLILSVNGELVIYRGRELTNFRNAETKSIYRLPEGKGQLWAPEIHFIDGTWYAYFAMGDANAVPTNRMWAIKSDTSDIFGGWSPVAQRMAPNEDTYAIDGTIMRYDGRLYWLWSGCEFTGMDPTFPQNLYIAPMSDPMTVSGPRVLIREPNSPWEMVDNAPINEGPQVIQHNGRTFVIFSASPAWSPDYCLGIFGIDDLKDPLVRSNWWNDKDECVFYRNDEQGVYGTGHAMVTQSPDGTEPWIIYHAMQDMNGGMGNRTIRVERCDWNPDGAPRFPRPSGFSVPLETPSGQ